MKHFSNPAPVIIGTINGKPVYSVSGGVEDPANFRPDLKTPVKDLPPVDMAVVKDEFKKALADHEAELHKTFEKYEKELAVTGSVSNELRADLKKMAEDYTGIRKDVNKILKEEAKFLDGQPLRKSPGTVVIESDEFQKLKQSGGRVTKSFDSPIFMKNTIIGEGGSPQDPQSVIVPRMEMPGIVPGAFRMLSVLDVIPFGVTASNLIHYTRELLFTNAAAETIEAGAKPETTLTFEDVTAPVRTIAHWLKVSKQVLDDAPALGTYIDVRLRYGVRLKLEQQLIAGDGTSPNISGLIGDTDNHTALSAVSGEVNLDAANRAKYAVIAADYMPDVFMINPADWSVIERSKGSDGKYIGADGVISYLQNGLVPVLWGLPVVLSNSITSGKFVCSSLAALLAWLRQEAVVTVHDQDEDNVQKNLLTVRGEMRAAFSVFRPAAQVVGSWPE